MPHVIVKLWPGKSQVQKQRLANAIARNVTEQLGYDEESVSVSFEEVDAQDWKRDVYQPDIAAHPDRLFKKPGYTM